MAEHIGLGATLKYAETDVTNASSFTTSNSTAISNIRSLTPPAAEVEDIDVTTLDSSGNAREFIPGLIDYGELSFVHEYDETERDTLQGFIRTQKSWLLTLPGDSTLYFQGYIKRIGIPEITHDGLVTDEFTIKIDGPVTFETA